MQLYYEERGFGATFLGIHGAGSSAVFWTDAAARLSELGRMVVYDRRGSHRSERPAPYETTSVREHADDALELLRELNADPAILIGRSYGGTIALELAIHQPESVRALALLEAGPMGLSPEYDEWFEGLAETLERTVAERGVSAVGEIVLREVFGAWEELPELWRGVFTTNGPALLAEIRGREKLSDNSLLAELCVPTLIVASNDSPAPLQRATDGLVRALPQARFARVAGGHAVDPAGPEVVAFIRELVGTRPARMRP